MTRAKPKRKRAHSGDGGLSVSHGTVIHGSERDDKRMRRWCERGTRLYREALTAAGYRDTASVWTDIKLRGWRIPWHAA